MTLCARADPREIFENPREPFENDVMFPVIHIDRAPPPHIPNFAIGQNHKI